MKALTSAEIEVDALIERVGLEVVARRVRAAATLDRAYAECAAAQAEYERQIASVGGEIE